MNEKLRMNEKFPKTILEITFFFFLILGINF